MERGKKTKSSRGRWGVFFLFLFLGVAGNVKNMVVAEIKEYLRDKVSPVISVQDEEYEIFLGEEVEFSPIRAEDDRDGEVPVECQGEYNKWIASEYEIKCRAEDKAGNFSEIKRIISVKSKENGGIVYLTFDDGPFDYTQTLLDALGKYQVKATFFVTGRGDDEDIVREHKEGHTVGLHTMSHDYGYIYANTENYFQDLGEIRERVKRLTGEEAKVIRFPGGSSNLVSRVYDGGGRIMSRLVDEVQARGYKYFDWNISSGDAGEVYTTEEVVENVTSRLYPGGEFVVLQHDIKGFSVEAVEEIVRFGLREGYEFRKITPESPGAHHGVGN